MAGVGGIRFVSVVLLAALCAAQESAPPVRLLTNDGLPIKVAFDCDDEDLAAAGMNCADDSPCAVYLELSSVAGFGRSIAVAGNLHGSGATISSILLMSSDAGATWKEASDRIAGSALEQVQLLDAGHAWAAGESQFPLARDPFVLGSTDGGSSWRKSAVADDTLVGSVQRFWFDSPEHGELIVDTGGRYVVFESKSGGAAWDASSSSMQMPRLKRFVETSDYRISDDAKARAFSVERRSGDKWVRVASFLVQAASCGTRHEGNAK